MINTVLKSRNTKPPYYLTVILILVTIVILREQFFRDRDDNNSVSITTNNKIDKPPTYLSKFALPVFSKEEKNDKPNFILIITDQMRGDAVSCIGGLNSITPNLDKLAEEGVIFENAYCNNPVCLPSRVSVFTGLYPHQHRALTNKGPYWDTMDNTLFDLFKKQGYRLGYVGKNHMLNVKKSVLEDYFDYYHFVDREDFRAYTKHVPPWWHGDTYEPSERCFTTTHTNEGIEFINKTNDPFFLVISYQDPHPPYMAPSEYSSQYTSDLMLIPEYIPPKNLSPRLDDYYRAMKFDEIKDTDLTETMRYYYASIAYIDDNVGRIIDRLDKKNISDNTIVIFTADHGDFMGEHRMVRKGMFHYEALLHVPMIWYGPGLIENRYAVSNLAQSVDIMPTIRDLLEVEIPESLPGRSLKPILQGQEIEDWDHFVFSSSLYYDLPDYILNDGEIPEEEKNTQLHSRVMKMPEKLDDKKRTASIRNFEWRFIKTEGYPSELYKMDGNWVERENLAKKPKYAKVVASFEEQIEEIWPE
ncbi:sulfatase [Bacteroidota bacterium]